MDKISTYGPYTPIDTHRMAQAYNSIRSYRSHTSSFRKALIAMYPMTGYVQNRYFSYLQSDDAWDLISNGVLFLEKFLTDHPLDKPVIPGVLFSFLNTSMRRFFTKVVTSRQFGSEEFLFEESSDLPYGHMLGYMDTYVKLDEEDIQRLLVSRFEELLRFRVLEGEACRYIFGKLRKGKLVSYEKLKSSFRMTRYRSEFFVQYTQTVYRRILYELREEYLYATERISGGDFRQQLV